MIYFGKDTSNLSKGKDACMSFQESSPCGVTENTLIPHPPVTNYDHTREMLAIREAHWRLSSQSFYWRLII